MIEHKWQTRTWEELKAETQTRANRGAYPVFDISAEDARDALDQIDSLDPDQWAAAWMSIGDRHVEHAKAGGREAPQHYLAAWRLYTLGRWPVMSSEKKRESYSKAQAAFSTYGQLVTPKIELLRIPFEGRHIEALLQKPEDASRAPVVVNIGGSDLWKDSVAIQARRFLAHGIAAVAIDMPGAADAPVGVEPGAERMVSAVIDHLLARRDVDGTRIVVRGQSWGSYWSARTAYTEAARLSGAVFQSGPVHLYFQREWQEKAFRTKEFLFDYVPSRLHMLGVKNVEDAFAMMPSLSLLDAGLLSRPTPPMLIIGGAKDSQVPFSDLLLLLQHGSPKYAWINPEGQTMGRSITVKDDQIFANVVVPWVRQVFGL
ncbi:MAG: alpha/beta hydrolase [Alphaproteobacteria bacterium]|nr:alpha/beta hydrolase [Alphaproteobacteria bacterium]